MKLKDGLDLIEGLVSTPFWSITKITNNPYLAKMQTAELIHTISDLAEILKEELKKIKRIAVEIIYHASAWNYL